MLAARKYHIFAKKHIVMGNTIEIRKSVSRIQLDKELEKIIAKKSKLNLRLYMGKVRFEGVDAIDYQKKMRDEWQ